LKITLRSNMALAFVLAIFAGSTVARAEIVPATSHATIYRPSTLASLLDLNFGSIVTGTAGGQISLDVASASRTCAPGMACSGAFAFATLSITGSNATVQVTYVPNIQLTGPGAPMDVAINFPGGSGALVTLVSNAATIEFGATLTVNPNQAGGDYAGQFSVDVNYP
jgi:Domain of unknown function (DUF4402)